MVPGGDWGFGVNSRSMFRENRLQYVGNLYNSVINTRKVVKNETLASGWAK